METKALSILSRRGNLPKKLQINEVKAKYRLLNSLK